MRATRVAIVGDFGVGKTFLSHALGHLACRRGASVLAVRTDKMLKALKHARLDNSYETELRRLLALGAEKARAISAPTLASMYERMGFVRL